jgi:hypothetical protein
MVINHAVVFSAPIAYLTGEGRLWVSAAEMFFLLSGIIFAVIRGDAIRETFRKILAKTWRRAAMFYAISILTILASMDLAISLISRGDFVNIPGAIPPDKSLHFVLNLLTFKYTYGWASFLMYYSVFLVFAPFLLYILKTRFWASIPLASALLFVLSRSHPIAQSPYMYFAVWQVYFVLGLVVGRFRLPVLSWFYNLNLLHRKTISYSIITLAGMVFFISSYITFISSRFAHTVSDLSWAPSFLGWSITYLGKHSDVVNYWMQNNRTGLLRPLATLLTMAALYLIYQKYNRSLLRYTGKFVNAFGRDSLWIFIAQAFMIPIISILPLPRHNLITNIGLTTMLLSSLWLITKRAVVWNAAKLVTMDLVRLYRLEAKMLLDSIINTAFRRESE